MSYILIVTIAIVIFSLIFDFINGFHDTANAVATAVSTRALTPRRAILLAAVMNFIGALTFTGVAGTITKDIVDPFKLQHGFSCCVSSYYCCHYLEFNHLVVWNTKFIFSRTNRIYSGCSHCIARFVCSITLSRFYKNYYRINHLPIIAFV